ncbi:hypothetical protein [Paraburkholderia humisilvae]|uniref:Uncharacterized protein n=1 Tax=Paraburkholderia humisilvae TaxID=627669 RepID=A0A6J5F7Z9_9BURK|nr:hypothetical protein [Paraburkholderia humisilvae]CAB3774970.1 hypothetical protein LMG29542_08352 [Paraburkholderia humisilvae]
MTAVIIQNVNTNDYLDVNSNGAPVFSANPKSWTAINITQKQFTDGTYTNAMFQDPVSKKYLSWSVTLTLSDSAEDAQFSPGGPSVNGVAPLPFSSPFGGIGLALGEDASKQPVAAVGQGEGLFKLSFDRS